MSGITPVQFQEMAEEALEWLDREEFPDTGREFAENVGKTIRGIMETVERTQFVTERQEASLIRMRTGIQKWLRGGRE